MSILFPSNHLEAVVLLIIIGCAMGVLYDAFKVKRMLFGCSDFVLFFDDLAYSCVFSATLIISVFFISNGIFRWYVVLAAFLGFFVYKCTLSHIVMLVFGFSVSLIHRLLKFAAYPINLLYLFFCNLFKPLILLFKRNSLQRKILRYIKKGSERYI